jgi:hypothetical protein
LFLLDLGEDRGVLGVAVAVVGLGVSGGFADQGGAGAEVGEGTEDGVSRVSAGRQVAWQPWVP